MDLARILCPVDFSEASEHAVAQAVVMAGFYKSHITALHVLTPLTLGALGVATSAEEEPDRRRRLTSETFAGAMSKGIAVDVLIDVGQPVGLILDRAANLPANLIVMGTHGTSGFQHLILGSVAEKVLRKAPCPVLTVPPCAQATSRLPFEHLLCAVDFSAPSRDALRSAFSLAQESGARLTLLHVLEWPWEEPPSPMPGELPFEQGVALSEFRRYMEASATNRLESLIPPSVPRSQVTVRLGNGKPYVQVLNAAAQERSDLIIVGVHGRNPIDMALFGSTTNQIVRRATCPVLTLRR